MTVPWTREQEDDDDHDDERCPYCGAEWWEECNPAGHSLAAPAEES